MNESDVADACDARLEAAGWFVFKTSQDKSTRRQLAGLPDRLCFRENVALLIEYKSPTGKARASQLKFADNIYPHLGENIHYMVLFHPRQLPKWATKTPS